MLIKVGMATTTRSGAAAPGWTFLSNHAHVLVVIARDSQVRVRDIASAVGITERAVMRILAELEVAGVIERDRQGRRTKYIIHRERHLRHPLEAEHCIDALLTSLAGPA